MVWEIIEKVNFLVEGQILEDGKYVFFEWETFGDGPTEQSSIA